MSVYYLLTIPKNSLYFVLFTLSYSVCIMYGTTVQLLLNNTVILWTVLPTNSYNVYNVLYCTLLPSTYPQLQCLYYLCCYTIYIPTHRISVYYCLRFLHSTYYTHTAYILCYDRSIQIILCTGPLNAQLCTVWTVSSTVSTVPQTV